MRLYNSSQYKKMFSFPGSMLDGEGKPRFAYVTFLIMNDSFIPGALLFAHLLRKKGTRADLVCMVSPAVSETAVEALRRLYHHVVEVEDIYVPNSKRQERQDLPFLFTRFQALRLGPDGDLPVHYEKIVMADADVLPLRLYDHLFSLDTPAGVLNERKELFSEYNGRGRYVYPDTVYRDGEWGWHREYNAICPHGRPIPKEITDRVLTDHANMGVNAALYVLSPSLRLYQGILDDLEKPEILRRINTLFRWPEMQYLTAAWSGTWHNIDIRFCGFKGYPDYRLLCGNHYAGDKPWNAAEDKKIRRLCKFEDIALWYVKFREMMERYPELRRHNKLRRLHDLLHPIPIPGDERPRSGRP